MADQSGNIREEQLSKFDETNQLLGMEVTQNVNTKHELTQHAFNALIQSDARFHAFFENAAVGVALMSLERMFINFNAATEKIIGYSFEEIKHINPRTLAVPEDRSMDDQLFRDLVEGKRESYVMERRYRRKDGRVIWARINYSLVRDLDRKPDYLVGIIEDIDEQKRAAVHLAEQKASDMRTLQERVEARTRELAEANERLRQEIEQRKKIEDELARK